MLHRARATQSHSTDHCSSYHWLIHLCNCWLSCYCTATCLLGVCACKGPGPLSVAVVQQRIHLRCISYHQTMCVVSDMNSMCYSRHTQDTVWWSDRLKTLSDSEVSKSATIATVRFVPLLYNSVWEWIGTLEDLDIFHAKKWSKGLNCVFQGQHIFSFIGPSILNNLPFAVQHARTLSDVES